MASANLSPFVYWGQTSTSISLKVDLRTVENLEVSLTEDGLSFSADGLGVKGLHKYDFHLDFYLPVDPEKSQYRKTEIAVEFQILKTAPETWPRLTSEKVKLPWLKIDFDKFMLNDSDASDTENKNQSEEDFINKIVTEVGQPKKKEMPSITKTYLFLYNLFQFVGFSYVTVALLAKYVIDGESAKQMAFETAGTQLMFCQIVGVLEVFNAAFGLVKSNVMTAFVQMIGRNFVLFVLILQEPRLQHSSLSWYLFLVWSSIETIRYPFYLLQLVDFPVRIVTWLRYTVWIPTYPLGILLEASIIVQSITYYSETGMFSFQLPNHGNVAFYFPYFLMFYLVLVSYGAVTNLNYMRLQRQKYLSGKTSQAAKKRA